MNAIRILVVLFLCLAGIGFIAGIIRAYYYSRMGTPDEMPAFLRQVVASIAGVLATNLGAVLGIKIAEANAGGFSVAKFFFDAQSDVPTRLQTGAAYLYLIGMLIAAWGWWRVGFNEDPNKVVVTLPQLSQTLLGVVAALLALTLGGR